MVFKPVKDAFLFEFCSDTAGGQFIEKNKGSIILTNQDMSHQADRARWVKVLAVGKDIKDFAPGNIVLVEALKWTTVVKHKEHTFWKSDAAKVIAVADDESVTYDYV
jgi:hypothetical protein